jgi:hypothetical protein
MEVIMSTVVAVVKPLLLQIATHPAVKNLVLDLLKKYVDSTDNSIDNVVYELVKDKLFTPQAEA